MKLKAAVAVSVILHISIFAIAIYMPTEKKSTGTTIYVDYYNIGGGGGGGGKGSGAKNDGTSLKTEPPSGRQSVKDLTTKTDEPQSSLRYPVEQLKKDKKNQKPDKKKTQKLIEVVRKDKEKLKKDTPMVDVTRRDVTPSNVLKTGIIGGDGKGGSGGSGGGSGGGIGTGTGTGYGPGSGPGSGFPYAYYIETLKNKISTSWYSALVSPGLRGKYTASVYFKILRNGQVKDLQLETKSGNDSLDLSALRAVENAAPFPPLPNDYIGGFLLVHFEFAWEKK